MRVAEWEEPTEAVGQGLGIHARDGAHMRLIDGVIILTVATVVATACTDELTFGGPLEIEISSNSPVIAADSLQVDYDVVGRSLLGMVVIWGDDGLDSLVFSGAQTAGGRIRHAYDTAGVYIVRVTAVDQIEGTASQELTATINP